MIYRVGDNDHPSYDYSRQKPTQVSGDSEKFSLDHQKKEELSPQKEEKGEDKKLHEKTKGASLREKSGVKLEISASGTKAASTREKDMASSYSDAVSKSAFWNSVRDTFQKFLQYAKDFLFRIWNDSSPEVESVDVTPEEAERYTQEYYALKKEISKEETSGQASSDKKSNELTELVKSTESVNKDTEIQKYLHSGNLEQVISLLTDNGKRSIAKNSTLLTYYDKNGRLTPLNPSDSERILHGDRNTRSL